MASRVDERPCPRKAASTSRALRMATLLMLAMLMSSCGTLMTRGGSASSRGWHYPGKSVVEDLCMIGRPIFGYPQPHMPLYGIGVVGHPVSGIVSLPIDLVLDIFPFLLLDIVDGIDRLSGVGSDSGSGSGSGGWSSCWSRCGIGSRCGSEGAGLVESRGLAPRPSS